MGINIVFIESKWVAIVILNYAKKGFIELEKSY